MKTTLLYFAQVIIASGILYGYYHFFLRNKKFHGYNRFYLLSVIFISVIIPFLNIPVYFETQQQGSSSLIHTLTAIGSGNFQEHIAGVGGSEKIKFHFSWTNFLSLVYYAAFILLSIRFIISIVKIIRLKRKFAVEKIDTIDFINTDEPGTPFSFFRNLFWNKKISLNSDEGQQILRHECFHIERNHSYDIIFAEIISIIFWINPFFYLIKKEIKTIHEFLADQFAANADEEWSYAELLLMQLLGSPTQRLTNPFFHNQIKRRIAMITSSKKPSYQYLRKLLVLPLAVIITALFAFKYKTKEITLHPVTGNLEKAITVVIDAGHGESDPGVIGADGTKESDITLQLAQRVKQLNKNDRIHIVLTRNSKEIVDLKKRSSIANAQNPDLFISLHANAAELNKDESGFEVYISKKNPTHLAENRILGTILLNYFMNIYKTTNKVQQQETGIWVLDNSQCPSALIECGYITNKQDLSFMKNPANQTKIAESILNSIEQFSMQKESPGFEDKKKQVSDTSKPVVKIEKDAAGKISATLNDAPVKSLYLDKQYGSAAFILDNGSLTVIPKEDVSILKNKYQGLWDEFCKSFQTDLSAKSENKSEETGANIVFTSTEIEPSFPGGEHAWISYLQKNLNANTPVDHSAPSGLYTVWVEFLVATDGTVSNIKTLTNHGFGMEQEVVKLFGKGQKWSPAIQNGHKVNAYKKQPVTFVVQEEKVGS